MTDLRIPAEARITDHPFDPRGEWWTLCKVCGLANSAHADRTTEGSPPYEPPPPSARPTERDEGEPEEDSMPPFAGPELDMVDVEAGELGRRKDG